MERLNEITRDISQNNESDIDQSRHQYSPFTNENINSLKCYYQGCDFRGVRKSQLLAHLRTHANERRFKCTHPGCEQRFAKRPYLVAHLRTHTGKFLAFSLLSFFNLESLLFTAPHQKRKMCCGGKKTVMDHGMED
ncbi:hypothetical protein ROZALSC1DRAFT_30079, partial [Rozella allomycis CSF55]